MRSTIVAIAFAFVVLMPVSAQAEVKTALGGETTGSVGWTDNVFESETGKRSARYYGIENVTNGVVLVDGYAFVVSFAQDGVRHAHFGDADADSARVTLGMRKVLDWVPLAGWAFKAAYVRAFVYEPTFDNLRGEVHIGSVGFSKEWQLPAFGGSMELSLGFTRSEVVDSIADRYGAKASLAFLRPLPGDVTFSVTPTVAWAYYERLQPTRTDWRWGATVGLSKAFPIRGMPSNPIQQVVLGIEASILRNESSFDDASFTRSDLIPKFTFEYKF